MAKDAKLNMSAVLNEAARRAVHLVQVEAQRRRAEAWNSSARADGDRAGSRQARRMTAQIVQLQPRRTLRVRVHRRISRAIIAPAPRWADTPKEQCAWWAPLLWIALGLGLWAMIWGALDFFLHQLARFAP
jgi:hypothetical protein